MVSKTAKSNRNFVTTQDDLATEFGVSRTTIQDWLRRSMPGKNRDGKYDIEAIREWRRKTFKRPPEFDRNNPKFANADKSVASVNDNRAKLLEAQARKETANAEMAELEVKLRTGNYAELGQVRLFMAEFFSQNRRLLSRIPVEGAKQFGKQGELFQKYVTARHEMVLKQMHDWTMQVQGLRTEK